MNVLDAIFTRRSIRSYTDKKIPDDDLTTVLKAGMHAPSAVNKQPWEFIVIKNKETFSKIMAIHSASTMLNGADTAILVCIDTNTQHADGYGIQDCSAAIQNMLLASHGLGIGGVWLGVFPRSNRMNGLIDLFQLPKHIQPLGIISLGYPAENIQQPNRFNQNKIHYENW